MATTPNYQGLWWAAAAGSESGWGINFAHQGDVIFATWFTYDTTGKAWWLGMQANRTATAVYAGTIFTTHGPAFNAFFSKSVEGDQDDGGLGDADLHRRQRRRRSLTRRTG